MILYVFLHLFFNSICEYVLYIYIGMCILCIYYVYCVYHNIYILYIALCLIFYGSTSSESHTN